MVSRKDELGEKAMTVRDEEEGDGNTIMASKASRNN